jgi:hypothetical protein
MGFLARLLSGGKQDAALINDYFCNAVTVYALASEEEAGLAAIAAAAISHTQQRASVDTQNRPYVDT